MEPICTIKDIYKLLYQFEKSFVDVNELTINEAMVLCCLKEGDAKTAGTISEYIGLSNSRVSKVINAVESRAFIRRLLNPDDKRQMLFVLTPEGRAKIEQMRQSQLGFDSLFEALRACVGER